MLTYRFVDKNNKDLYVAWLGPISRQDTKPLRLPGAVATVTNIYGVTHTITDVQDGQVDGHVTLPVGAQPIYVHIQP
jgi:hypothetical protein